MRSTPEYLATHSDIAVLFEKLPYEPGQYLEIASAQKTREVRRALLDEISRTFTQSTPPNRL